jgi:hypothetical protein
MLSGEFPSQIHAEVQVWHSDGFEVRDEEEGESRKVYVDVPRELHSWQ